MLGILFQTQRSDETLYNNMSLPCRARGVGALIFHYYYYYYYFAQIENPIADRTQNTTNLVKTVQLKWK